MTNLQLSSRISKIASHLRKGISIVEVVMAVSIIAIMFAVLTPALIDNSKRTAITGQTAQASLFLNFFVRQIVGGNSQVLASAATPLQWNYGQLSSSSLGLTNEKDLAKPDLYKVTISNQAIVSLLGSSATQYEVKLCFKQGNDEICIQAHTLGPAPTASGSGTILPGIN